MIKREVFFENARLILGDSYEILNQESIVADAIVTDPPYQFNNSGGGKFRKARKASNDIQATGLSKGFDYERIPWSNYGSSVVFCHNDQLIDLGSKLQQEYRRTALLSYHKVNPSPMANKHYLADTEFYIHSWNRGSHPLGSYSDKFRFIVTSNGAQSTFAHPTVKPMNVMDKIMRNVNGDVILDPFMGTGTTGESALRAKKSFIGIEKDENYFEMAVQRFKNMGLQEIFIFADDEI